MKFNSEFTDMLKEYLDKNNLMVIDRRDYDKWKLVCDAVLGRVAKQGEAAK